MHGTDGASTLMSIRDAARASGLSPKALRRRIERGTLGSVLVGGRRRIPVDDLVRRGLVADEGEPATTDDQAAMARRLRALELRVAALESALEAAGRPMAATVRGHAPLVVDDPRNPVAPGSEREPSPSR
jgi:hypothetical protein